MPSFVAVSDEVKLMPDYCCGFPLWYRNWWTLGLSTDLLNALADWQDDFDGNFDPIDLGGWRNPGTRHAWTDQAEVLTGRLRKELQPEVELIVDLWPLEDED